MNRALALLVFVFLTNSVFAQSDFFYSPHDLGFGAVNEPMELELAVGEEATVFLYYTTQEPTTHNRERMRESLK